MRCTSEQQVPASSLLCRSSIRHTIFLPSHSASRGLRRCRKTYLRPLSRNRPAPPRMSHMATSRRRGTPAPQNADGRESAPPLNSGCTTTVPSLCTDRMVCPERISESLNERSVCWSPEVLMNGGLIADIILDTDPLPLPQPPARAVVSVRVFRAGSSITVAPCKGMRASSLLRGCATYDVGIYVPPLRYLWDSRGQLGKSQEAVVRGAQHISPTRTSLWCVWWRVVCGVVCGVWCVVCGVWCVVCGVWCVVCGVWCGVVSSFSPAPSEEEESISCRTESSASFLERGMCVWWWHTSNN
jgi:hypothetical protein